MDSASGRVLSAGLEGRCRTASAAHSARLSRLESPRLAAEPLADDDSLPEPVWSATSASESASEGCRRRRRASSDCAHRSTERSAAASRSRAAARSERNVCAAERECSRRSASDRAARTPNAQCAGSDEKAIDSRCKFKSKALNERSVTRKKYTLKERASQREK